jgi:hypothetical protein
VDRDFERAFRSIHFTGKHGIWRLGLSEQKHFQLFEVLQAAVLYKLVPEL